MSKKAKVFRDILIRKLLESGVLTQSECDTLRRKGSRKRWYYKRHIRDLCEYTLDKMRRETIENEYVEKLCRQFLMQLDKL